MLAGASLATGALMAPGLSIREARASLLPPLPEAKPTAPSLLSYDVRKLSFINLHTDEKLAVPYFENGRYVADAMHTIKHFMRDVRDGTEHDIDPATLDILTAVHMKLESSSPYYIISGYRSPKTNALLAAQTTGVAKHSLHMKGKAIDLRLADRSLSELHQVALSLKAGGVGYYPRSNFVHLDSGAVRTW